MPVIEKIEKYCPVEIWQNHIDIHIGHHTQDITEEKIEGDGETKLMGIYNGVIKFITWYNTQYNLK